MKLFQYIASIFKPRLSKSKTDNNEDNIAADIKFLLDKDNNPYVKISISDTSLESADKFAALLYDINKGLYLESMVQVLIEMGGQDININKYVKRIFKRTMARGYSFFLLLPGGVFCGTTSSVGLY